MDVNLYRKVVSTSEPKTPLGLNLVMSFVVGGGMCAAAEVIYLLLRNSMKDDVARLCVSLIFILISAVITACGLFDRLVKIGGAGMLIPITGFANAMISSAIEYRSEGYVLGVGVKLFNIAGPVLVFGITSSVLYGILYALMKGIIALL